jgi:hypothetical protein
VSTEQSFAEKGGDARPSEISATDLFRSFPFSALYLMVSLSLSGGE